MVLQPIPGAERGRSAQVAKHAGLFCLIIACAACRPPAVEKPMFAHRPSVPRTPINETVKAVVDEYIARHQKWPTQAYYLEDTGRVDPNGNAIINAVYKEDEKPQPLRDSGGQSLEVHVSIHERRVTRVLRFQ